ncbi:MAG: 30S ribosomal protein S12 methylthiotransferase RimO [Armatimonadetes bacterium]|nr:30S ribosomal protein S12 methylthiotransferase RimO [Armatimonadota bacterium]
MNTRRTAYTNKRNATDPQEPSEPRHEDRPNSGHTPFGDSRRAPGLTCGYNDGSRPFRARDLITPARKRHPVLKAPHQPTVQLINLGCAKNVVDSEEMLGALALDGFAIKGQGRRADVVVINTCGFLKASKAESLGAIRDATRRKRRGEVGRVVVAGCLVQRCSDELAKLPDVDALIGTGLNGAVARAASGNGHAGKLVNIAASPTHQWSPIGRRVLSTPPWTAYLKIGEGCDHTCAFCTIPAIRGPYTSKPLDMVVAEAAELAERGVVELTLVAQDTTRYGHDLPGKPDLPLLLRELSGIGGVRWIRVFYAYPSPMIYRLAEAIASLPKVCAYMDVPLQHSDGGILRRMHRPGDAQSYLSMLGRLRETVPDLAFRTTLIAGLPGETEEEFAGLLRFVEAAQFDRLGVFEFSPEPGTTAATMPGQVPEPIRRRRRDGLMRLQQGISLNVNRRWVGREMDVLIEAVGGDRATGRTFRDGPEVDGTVVVGGSDIGGVQPGEFQHVRITDAGVYDLVGEVCDGH